MHRLLAGLLALAACSAPAGAADPVARSASGAAIPQPTSKQTYRVKDGERAVQIPEGMVYLPAGEFTFGTRKATLGGYCIGKYSVTNAEYQAFLDATGGRAQGTGRAAPTRTGRPTTRWRSSP